MRNMFHRRPEEALEALDGAIMGTERAITESQVAIEGLRDVQGRRERRRAAFEGNGEELVAHRGVQTTMRRPSACSLRGSDEHWFRPSGMKSTVLPERFYEMLFRHAHARRIEAEILYDEHQFRLRVRDDGKGMDPQVLEKGGRARTLGVARCSGTSAANGSKSGFLGRGGKRNGSSINRCRCHRLRKDTRSLRIQIIPQGEKS